MMNRRQVAATARTFPDSLARAVLLVPKSALLRWGADGQQRVWITLLLLTLLASACQGLSSEPQIVATLPVRAVKPQTTPEVVVQPGDAANLALGERIYSENCTRCHGLMGRGDGEMVTSGKVLLKVDFTNPTTAQNANPTDWFRIITDGNLDALMPPWRDKLTDAERWAVTYYVLSLSKSQPLVKGSVSGVLVNGTAGASIPATLPVQLHILDQEMNEKVLDATAANGVFQFNDVLLQANRNYVVTANYRGANYASDLTPGNPQAKKLDLAVKIYEFTDDPAVLQINGLSSQASIVSDQLQVIQIVSLTNTSDRTFRSSDGKTSVRMNAPEGARLVDFMGGSDRFIYSADGKQVTDTLPVVPGQTHTLHLMYALPYAGGASIRQTVDYKLAQGYEVLLDTPGITVEGAGIKPFGGRSTASGTLMSFGDESPQAAGSVIQFTMRGSPTTTAQTATSETRPAVPSLALLLIAGGVLSILAAGALYVKERQVSRRALAAEADAVQTKINVLVREIADLDMAHQAGSIKRAAYDKRRTKLKSELMVLMKKAGQ
jgi:mono/diheme cytochrome c family protein